MDVLNGQIKLYESLIQNYTDYLQCLKNHLAQTKTDIKLKDIPESNTPAFDAPAFEMPFNIPESEIQLEDIGQDMIWQRIRQAHLGDENTQTNTGCVENTQTSLGYAENTQTNTGCVENTQTSLGYAENNLENLELNLGSNRDVKKTNTISRLSRFTTLKQNQIIKNIFIKARENMKILSELDNNILDNMEENVNKEADRILEVYLNEGGDYEN